MRLWLLAVLCLAAFGQPVVDPESPPPANFTPAPSDLDGRTITRVDYEPAQQPVLSEDLYQLVPFHEGDPLRAADARVAINQMFSTGRYADIIVEAEPDGANGVVVTIVTELAYFVSRVSIQGEKEPPNEAQLVAATGLDIGERFLAEYIPGAISRMAERLRANGFYNARIRSRFETTPATEEVNIFFTVETGSRASFYGADFTGTFTETPKQLERATDWHRSIGPIPLPGWREVTEARVQNGLTNLRELQTNTGRLEARVNLTDLQYNPQRNGVQPRVDIRNGPVTLVRTTGAKVGQGDLEKLIPIYQERTVDRGLLVEGQRNLTEYLQSRGYFDAAVSFNRYTEQQNGRQESVIDYQIDRGERHKLDRITFSGNRYFDDETLQERMYIRTASLIRYRNGRFSPQLLEEDLNSIRNLYRSNGFRDVEVTSVTRPNPQDPGLLALEISIQEGSQWFVNSLVIAGVPEDDNAYFMGVLRSTAGQPSSEVNVAADRETILTYYYDRGFDAATFEWTQNEIDDDLVDLRYGVTLGERHFVREVLIRGLVDTDPELVRSRITLQPGQPISQVEISRSQQNLYDLGIFANVRTAIQNPDGQERSKYVIFYLNEANKYSMNFGVGAELGRFGGGSASFSMPAGATGFAPRLSFGVSRINFLGIGHTISLQTLASTRQRRALMNYIAPHFEGNDDLSLTFSALYDDSRNIRTFNARRWEGTVQLSRKLSASNSIQFRYAFRWVTINNLKIDVSQVPFYNKPVRVGLVGVNFFRDRRDDPVETHYGTYNTVDLSWAAGRLGSETGFTRLLARNSTYTPLGRELVLARTVQFGYMQRLTGLPQIPLAERFFAGGASSLRAFPANQAGPRDPYTGFPVGGEALLIESTELRFPLIGDSIGGVLFHDMGNVFDNIKDIGFRFAQRNFKDFNYLVQGAGFGIRLRTPVGPLRVDLSYSPNSPRFYACSGTTEQCQAGTGQTDVQRINPFQFHFSLGQTF